jgi:putative sterol carrier protein
LAAIARDVDLWSFPEKQIEANIKANPDVAKKINGSYLFVLATSAGEESWIVDLKKPLVAKQAGQADCTISMKEEDFLAMVAGKLDGQQAFMQGKLKIKGNMQLAMSLGSLVGNKAKL